MILVQERKTIFVILYSICYTYVLQLFLFTICNFYVLSGEKQY